MRAILKNRAVFLDRDGVINRKAREGAYVTSWEEMKILPGVPHAISLLNRSGFLVVLITNQRCIAKGLITVTELEHLHQRLQDCLKEGGARIDGIYVCPHDTKDCCSCRKPKPGMIFQAADEKDIDLSSSWMIGDSESDIDAGSKAGCMTALISDSIVSTNTNLTAPSLLDCAREIVSRSVTVIGRE